MEGKPLTNRIAIYAFALAALVGGLAPVWADLDWESTIGVITAIGTLATVLYKWLDGWQGYEERQDLIAFRDSEADEGANIAVEAGRPRQ